MARLKLLFVAVVVAALGGWYLSQRAEAEASRIRQTADERLRQAVAPVNALLAQDGQAALASVKAAAQGPALAQATDAEGKPDSSTLEAARAALERVQSPEAERPVLIAVAAQGVVGRYRVGQSNRIDHEVAAFPPLVNPGPLPRAGVAALDGEIYRFAVAQFEDLKVPGAKGLLLVGFPIDDGFAQRLAAAAGLDISLVDGGKILGSTLPPADRQALQIVASGAKGTVSFGAVGGDRFIVTDLVPPLAPYLGLPFFVVGHRYRGAVVPAAAEVSPEVKLIAAVRTGEGYGAIADEQRQLLIGLAIVVLLCIILAIFSRNAARGLSAVVTAAERAVQGDREARAPTVKMSSLVRRAAVAINSLASQAEGSAQPKSQPPPDLAEQLGIRPTRNAGSLVAVPADGPPAGFGVDENTARSAMGFPSAEPSPTTQPPIPYGAPSPSRKSNPSPEPMVLPQKPKPMATPLPPQPEGEYNPDATVIVPAQAFARVPSIPAPRATASIPASPPSPVPLPSPSPSPFAAGSPSPFAIGSPSPFAIGSEEAHFQQVYKDFVASKEKCGEPADGLTYEKFAAKLRKNQEQLIAKYACRSVRFQVYVKDGKTALKAQPIK